MGRRQFAEQYGQYQQKIKTQERMEADSEAMQKRYGDAVKMLEEDLKSGKSNFDFAQSWKNLETYRQSPFRERMKMSNNLLVQSPVKMGELMKTMKQAYGTTQPNQVSNLWISDDNLSLITKDEKSYDDVQRGLWGRTFMGIDSRGNEQITQEYEALSPQQKQQYEKRVEQINTPELVEKIGHPLEPRELYAQNKYGGGQMASEQVTLRGRPLTKGQMDFRFGSGNQDIDDAFTVKELQADIQAGVPETLDQLRNKKWMGGTVEKARWEEGRLIVTVMKGLGDKRQEEEFEYDFRKGGDAGTALELAKIVNGTPNLKDSIIDQMPDPSPRGERTMDYQKINSDYRKVLGSEESMRTFIEENYPNAYNIDIDYKNGKPQRVRFTSDEGEMEWNWTSAPEGWTSEGEAKGGKKWKDNPYKSIKKKLIETKAY